MSIYKLFNTPRKSEELGAWDQYLGNFDQVIGYSLLGALFLKSSFTNEYLVLYPLRSGSNSKNYGVFNSVSDFEEKILHHPTFTEYCLHPVTEKELNELRQRLGPLDDEQVYFPVPHPSVGGSWDISSYEKGNLWIFADIACQNHGW